MIPKVAKSGHSFKGAAAYYLHDKTQDNAFNHAAGAHAKTADRVEWTETRNLATNNPDLAWKIMAASAMDGEYLKQQQREAEGKRSQASGDTNGKSVYAYSLAWSPDEKGTINRDDMTAAAEQTLEQLGFKDHQAIFICHNDTDHPHVHVLVNKVNPETGKTHNPHRDFNKLDKWARDYRLERGEEHLCPNREQKWKNHEEQQSNKNREKQTSSRLEKGESATLSADRSDSQRLRTKNARLGDRISQFSTAQKQRHTDEWAHFKSHFAARKTDIFAKSQPFINGAKDDLSAARLRKDAIYQKYAAISDNRILKAKDKFRPVWSALGKKQWRDSRAWEARETTRAGRFVNAVAGARMLSKHSPLSQGFLKDLRTMTKSKEQRAAAIVSIQSLQKQRLTHRVNAEYKAIRKAVNKVRATDLISPNAAIKSAKDALTDIYGKRSAELGILKMVRTDEYRKLSSKQQGDNARVRAAWANLKQHRSNTLKRISAKIAQGAQVRHANAQAFKAAVKDEIQTEAKKQGRQRNRSKERKPRSRGRTQKLDR